MARDVDLKTDVAARDPILEGLGSIMTYKPAGTNAVVRPIAEKLAEITSVLDFIDPDEHASILAGTSVYDAGPAIQAAIDHVISRGGGVVECCTGLRTSITLSLGSFVILQGGTITGITNNIPIIRVDKLALNSYWQIRDMVIKFQTLQVGTDGVGIDLSAANKISFNYQINNVRIDSAYNAIRLLEATGCQTFLGTFNNVRANQCSSAAFNILGTVTGANTNLSFYNCWHLGVTGAPIVGSSMCIIKRTQNLLIRNMAADNMNSQRICLIESCDGRIDSMAVEASPRTASSSTSSFFEFSGSRLTIGSLTATDCDITLSGTASFAHTRLNTSAYCTIALIEDKNTVVTDTSSDAYYTVIIDSTSVLLNEKFHASGASPALSHNEFGSNTRYSIRRLNGVDRTRLEGNSKYVVWGTAAPTTLAWSVGDKMFNTAPAAGGFAGWVCTTAGTPGTWKGFGAIEA